MILRTGQELFLVVGIIRIIGRKDGRKEYNYSVIGKGVVGGKPKTKDLNT